MLSLYFRLYLLGIAISMNKTTENPYGLTTTYQALSLTKTYIGHIHNKPNNILHTKR